jgi:demethylmenaquinone methyltransferase/2-methoxy-6-polyprenyl-1,4-benzoquinol methylase
MAALEPSNQDKAAQVRAMFSAIAPRYDLLNRLLSLGLDTRWRDEAVRVGLEHRPKRILDVATGTADVALALKRAKPDAEVIGVDFAEPMLAIGRKKAAREGLDVALMHGDGMALPFPEERFDLVTIAYGLRNFSSIERGLAEFNRVLAPGGRLIVLEFPPPPAGLVGDAFRLYFLHLLPHLGRFISGHPEAYRYLPDSVMAFPEPRALAATMHRAGFARVRYRLQSMGVSALYAADKT